MTKQSASFSSEVNLSFEPFLSQSTNRKALKHATSLQESSLIPLPPSHLLANSQTRSNQIKRQFVDSKYNLMPSIPGRPSLFHLWCRLVHLSDKMIILRLGIANKLRCMLFEALLPRVFRLPPIICLLACSYVADLFSLICRAARRGKPC